MNRNAPTHTLLVLGLLASAACTESSDATHAAESRGQTSPMIQQLSGLSHLPAPASTSALNASMRRHFPRHLAGVRARTAVLVDVAIDAHGRVGDVHVIEPSSVGGDNVRAVVLEKVPGTNQLVEREVQATYDAAFGAAAQAALREVRFLPALRGGRPVPFTMRMTVEFADPGART